MKTTTLMLCIVAFAASCSHAGTGPSDLAIPPVQPTETAVVTAPEVAEVTTGAAEVAPPVDNPIVFTWTGSGGCNFGGRCARYQVSVDGTVETSDARGHTGPTSDLFGTGTEATGTIDADTLERWLDVVNTTDIDAVLESNRPGRSYAAIDGTDYVVEIPHIGTVISSIDFSFSDHVELFAAAKAMARAAYDAAPLPQQ